MRHDPIAFVSGPSQQSDVGEDDVVDSLRDMGSGLTLPQAGAVAAILSTTTSAKIRNAAALALLDARYQEFERAVNDVLARPGIAPVAGTLLYCLGEDAKRVAAAVVPNLVRNGSFEARSELLMLTSRRLVSFESEADKTLLRSELEDITRSANPDAAEVASLAIEDLEEVLRVDRPPA